MSLMNYIKFIGFDDVRSLEISQVLQVLHVFSVRIFLFWEKGAASALLYFNLASRWRVELS